jgi:hypothetical protein
MDVTAGARSLSRNGSGGAIGAAAVCVEVRLDSKQRARGARARFSENQRE